MSGALLIWVTIDKLNKSGETIEVRLFTLLQWRSALKLEMKGFSATGGRSVATHVRRLLGVPRYPIKKLYDYIDATIKCVDKQLGIEEEGR
jgi:hypothetical protein